MMDITVISPFILWLLPALFILHDLEEMLSFKPWLRRNGQQIRERFPAPVGRMVDHLENISVKQFAAMATEELVILTAVTVYASLSANYYPWLALLLAFGLHLLAHLAQWLVMRRYVPSAITSLLCLPVFIYIVWTLAADQLFTLQEFILCAIAGTLVVAVNLFTIHQIASYAAWKATAEKKQKSDN